MAGKGNPKTGGRPKGGLNKVTAEIKGMIEQALQNVGGVAYLERQAEENPTAFMGLLGKILPKDVNVDVDGSLTLRVVRRFVKKADA